MHFIITNPHISTSFGASTYFAEKAKNMNKNCVMEEKGENGPLREGSASQRSFVKFSRCLAGEIHCQTATRTSQQISAIRLEKSTAE